jgi:hypothetical protein
MRRTPRELEPLQLFMVSCQPLRWYVPIIQSQGTREVLGEMLEVISTPSVVSP